MIRSWEGGGDHACYVTPDFELRLSMGGREKKRQSDEWDGKKINSAVCSEKIRIMIK